MALIRCGTNGSSGGDFSDIFPLTLTANFSTSAQMAQSGTITNNGFIVPLVGVNHITITDTTSSVGTWSYEADDGTTITKGANIDVSSYKYIKASFFLSWLNNSVNNSATITMVD